jgi:3-hydroxyacyl-CoA dehydrogenase
VDLSPDALHKRVEAIRDSYAGNVKKGKLSEAKLADRMGCISTATALSDEKVAAADIVIEAVFERMDLKKKIFAQLDTVAKPGALLCTNTSTLDIDQIAAATSRPQDVCGTQ